MNRLWHLLAILIALTSLKAESQTVSTFDWSDPGTLTPQFSAPTSSNRYGEYIGDVVFTGEHATLVVVDSLIKEQSQQARFLYGYNTGMVEMRAYPGSFITIKATDDDHYITQVEFQGAKVGIDYLDEVNNQGSWSRGTWTAGDERCSSVTFGVYVTINCTATIVYSSAGLGVPALSSDDSDTESAAEYYTLTGQRVTAPVKGNLYLRCSGANVSKVLYR